jgi:hypothetical protein
MPTLTEIQDAYDRHRLKYGIAPAAVADVILTLEAKLSAARADLAATCIDRDRALARWRDVCDQFEVVCEERDAACAALATRAGHDESTVVE